MCFQFPSKHLSDEADVMSSASLFHSLGQQKRLFPNCNKMRRMNSELVDTVGSVSLLCVTQIHDVVYMIRGGRVHSTLQHISDWQTSTIQRHQRRSWDVADCEQMSQKCVTDDKCVWWVHCQHTQLGCQLSTSLSDTGRPQSEVQKGSRNGVSFQFQEHYFSFSLSGPQIYKDYWGGCYVLH